MKHKRLYVFAALLIVASMLLGSCAPAAPAAAAACTSARAAHGCA